MTAQLSATWLHDYGVLALRLDRLLTESRAGPGVIYTGPAQWRTEVDDEGPADPARLVTDCDELSVTVPFDGLRADRLRTYLASMKAAAGLLAGSEVPFRELAGRCLGLAIDTEPEERFAAAQDDLDTALPPGPGSSADRYHSWQRSHHLPAGRVADAARRAVDECLVRTRSLVTLPDTLDIDVRVESGPHRGDYVGNGRSIVYVSDNLPFNAADLFYVVAHEAFPGHITESILKYENVDDELERAVRFMMSPAFVVSEGIGLHAQSVIFPGDEAQRWITDEVLSPLGIRADGSDVARIHDARNVFWGAWANAAILAVEGATDAEVAEYLKRWALLTDDATEWAVGYIRSRGAAVYMQTYFQGWQSVGAWLEGGEVQERVRHLLAEPLLPAELDDGATDLVR